MLLVKQVKIDALNANLDAIKEVLAKKLKTSLTNIKNIEIIKKSIDARNKDLIYYVYELKVELYKENIKFDKDITEYEEPKFIFSETNKNINKKIVIVGSGPAGLFCAYMLSQNGVKVTLIERGKPVDERIQDVQNFWNNNKLNVESNVQFGEGGAGTFSDGKLNTMIKDPLRIGYEVLKIFVNNGAPKEILFENKPHIGTDILLTVVKNMRNKIIDNGSEVLFNTKLTNIIYKNNKLESIEVNNQKIIPCDNLVLAIGHSARDTFKMLYKQNVLMEPKPFAVGVRVQHDQDKINLSQYGKKYAKILPPCSYKLTYTCASGRGVYSFCMCPGGYVVNSSSENNKLAINGMSYSRRDSGIANSAIIVTVTPDDFGHNPLDGVAFQQELESNAYNVGHGNIPTTTLKDYNNNVESSFLGSITPKFKGNYQLCNLNKVFPEYINISLKEAFKYYGTKIKDFDNPNTVISAVESRTSSPVRIIRNDLMESNIKGIYPCGEGAGYAGGITSSAIDGIKVAMAIYNN